MAHMYSRTQPRYALELEPCSTTFFIEDSWVAAERMNEFEQVSASEQEVESYIIRVSESGVPYRQSVNWCARSTFYSEKSAWKEFDRRHHAVVHNTAYDALPSPHDQGLQSRSVETPKPREDYFTSRTAQLPTKPAAPNADPFVAFEDENVTTMEAWIQGMNTKANMSMQEAAETGHLLRHQLPGHGSVLKSRPCSVCGLQSQQECPGGCANWLCPTCAPHYTRYCTSCSTTIPHATYESQLSSASTQYLAPNADARRLAEKGQPSVQELTYSRHDLSYSKYEKQTVPFASQNHPQSSRDPQPDHLAGLSDQEKMVMQQDWPPPLAGHTHMVRSPVTTTTAQALMPTPTSVPPQLLKLDARAKAFGLDPVNSPSVSTRMPRREMGAQFETAFGAMGTEGKAAVQFEDPYGAKITDFTDGSPVVLPGHQTGRDARKQSLQWADDTGEVKMIVPDLDLQFSPRPSGGHQADAGLFPAPPAMPQIHRPPTLSDALGTRRPPSLSDAQSIHRPPSLTEQQPIPRSLTTVHQPATAAKQTDRLSPSPPPMQGLVDGSLKARAERHTKDWFASRTSPSDNPTMTAWTLPSSEAARMDSKYHAASSNIPRNPLAQQPQIEPATDPEPQALQLDDLQVDSPAVSPTHGGRSDPPPPTPAHCSDVSPPSVPPPAVGPSLFLSPSTSGAWRPAPIAPPPRARDLAAPPAAARDSALLPPPRSKDLSAFAGSSPPPPARRFAPPSAGQSALDEQTAPLPQPEPLGTSLPPRSLALDSTAAAPGGGRVAGTWRQQQEEAPSFLLDRKSVATAPQERNDTPSFLLDRKKVATPSREEEEKAVASASAAVPDEGWEAKLLFGKQKEKDQEKEKAATEGNWRSRLRRVSQGMDPGLSLETAPAHPATPTAGGKTAGLDPALPRTLPASPQRLASHGKGSSGKADGEREAAGNLNEEGGAAGGGSVREMIQRMQGGGGGSWSQAAKAKQAGALGSGPAGGTAQGEPARAESGGSTGSGGRRAASERAGKSPPPQQQLPSGASERSDANDKAVTQKRPGGAAQTAADTPAEAPKAHKKKGFLASLLGRGKDSKA